MIPDIKIQGGFTVLPLLAESFIIIVYQSRAFLNNKIICHINFILKEL